ncbi:MAG: DMT family transporter [Candidatus Puniceispirillales bacterium]
MTDDQRGILCILAGVILFSVQDVFIKAMADDASLIQIIVLRGLVGGMVLMAYLRFRGKPISFATAYPWLSVLRAVFFFTGYLCFYIALTAMPIASATSIFFVSPFFITMISWLVLKNPVGLYRFSAIVVGFIGMVMIIKPDPAVMDWVAILPVYTALSYAISMMIARYTRDQDTVWQQTMHMYLGTIIFGLIAAAVIPFLDLDQTGSGALNYLLRPWAMDDTFIISAIILISCLSTVGTLMLLSAYRIGNPSVVAPFEYAMLITAIISGFVFFGEIPDLMTFGGMILIVSSGIFIFIREGIRKAPQVATKTSLRG